MANPFGPSSGSTNPIDPFAGITGMSLDYLNANPTAGWGQYVNTFGAGGDPYSTWLRGQQNQYYTKYSGENAKDNNLSWTDYLKTINPQAEFAAQAPYSRGITPSSWSGRTRWSL